METLSGLFEDASAGGIVWKERKCRKENKRKNSSIRYAYYQFYDKRKPKGKRKIQRYIRKEDQMWAFRWIKQRKKKWEKLKELKRELKKLQKGLKVFAVDVQELDWEIKARKIEKGLTSLRV